MISNSGYSINTQWTSGTGNVLAYNAILTSATTINPASPSGTVTGNKVCTGSCWVAASAAPYDLWPATGGSLIGAASGESYVPTDDFMGVTRPSNADAGAFQRVSTANNHILNSKGTARPARVSSAATTDASTTDASTTGTTGSDATTTTTGTSSTTGTLGVSNQIQLTWTVSDASLLIESNFDDAVAGILSIDAARIQLENACITYGTDIIASAIFRIKDEVGDAGSSRADDFISLVNNGDSSVTQAGFYDAHANYYTATGSVPSRIH